MIAIKSNMIFLQESINYYYYIDMRQINFLLLFLKHNEIIKSLLNNEIFNLICLFYFIHFYYFILEVNYGC